MKVDDSDDSDGDVGVPLVVVDSLSSAPTSQGKGNRKEQPLAELPMKGYVDTAILDCFQLAVRTHDYGSNGCITISEGHPGTENNCNEMDWKSPLEERSGESLDTNKIDLSVLKTWNPKPLTLPVWAVDPYVATNGSVAAKGDVSETSSKEPEKM